MGGAGDLLRRHISGGTGDNSQFAAAGRRLVEREAEVDEHGNAAGREDDIGGLHVAVNRELGMRVSERVGDGGDNRHSLLPRGRVVFQPVRQILAVEIVGDDEDLAVLRADVVHRHDSRVAQPGKPPRLLQQTVGLGGRSLGAAAKDLDRDRPVELAVVTQIDRSKAALSQHLPHLVAAERGRGRGWGSRRPCDRRSGDCPGNKRLLRGRRLGRKLEEQRRHSSRFRGGKIGRVGSCGTIHPVRSLGS